MPGPFVFKYIKKEYTAIFASRGSIMKEVYIVAGASAGIGKSLCSQLAKRGKHTIAIARREDKLKQLQAQYPDLITYIVADLSTESDRKHICDNIPSDVEIVGLINNAATTGEVTTLAKLSIDKWHQALRLNTDGPIFLTQALMPRMQKARVMNVVTYLSLKHPMTGTACYSMSKIVITAYSRFLNVEFENTDCEVVAAHPGSIDTELSQSVLDSDDELGIKQHYLKSLKNNKLLDLESSGKFLTWLLLDADSSYYTGEVHSVYDKDHQQYWANKEIRSPFE